MPDKHVWMTEAALADLRRLKRRWNLESDSATIARALAESVEREP